MDSKADHAFHPRVEDDALLRGAGRFVDDLRVPGQAYAVFVRSPHAHARIVSVNIDEARQAPDVLAVLTAADMQAAGVRSSSHHMPMTGRGGAKLPMPFRPALAGERVMHVGEAVAMVVAETRSAAHEAADLVAVEYAELAAAVDIRNAAAPGAPQLWPEAPGNLALDFPGPVPSEDNEREVARILQSAPRVVRVAHAHQRMVVASLEPRGGTGSYDAASDRYTLRVCSQSAGALHGQLAPTMGVDKTKVRVLTDDVGGAFGMKTPVYPEYPALLVAARKLGRPVHWMSTRSEAFISDNQARDSHTEAELALDERGKFLALRVRHLTDQGAYVASPGVHINTNNFSRCFPTMYRIPKIDVGVRCVFTNTLPVGPYRGAGRPEANYIMERLIEAAARETGIDPAALRKRNLIPPSAIPYKTAVGTTYDSGNFPAVVERALTLGDYAGFRKRRRESAKRNRYRGIGISCFLEHSGSTPTESAALLFPGGDKVVLHLGVQSTGQAHATVYPRIIAQRLGIRPELIQHRHGDSDFGLPGAASVGSRSTMTAGAAVVRAVDVVLEKGRKLAAQMLEASEADIGYRNGLFEVVGTDRRISLFEVAERAKALRGEPGTLDTKESVDTPQTFPNGCHIAEVEIDPQTGLVEVVRYTAVDDCGTVLDHTIVEAQVHGGVAQGLGQALLENAVYEAGSGQLLAATFMDYAMPRAHHMPPAIRDDIVASPAKTNPLGVKGVGEAGTTASIGAIMNAIADAIPGGAGARLDMPATPARVWEALQEGAKG
jgi:carbon-monoxide dehydrogenase large subunit